MPRCYLIKNTISCSSSSPADHHHQQQHHQPRSSNNKSYRLGKNSNSGHKSTAAESRNQSRKVYNLASHKAAAEPQSPTEACVAPSFHSTSTNSDVVMFLPLHHHQEHQQQQHQQISCGTGYNDNKLIGPRDDLSSPIPAVTDGERL